MKQAMTTSSRVTDFTKTMAYTLGRGVRVIEINTVRSVEPLSPLKAGAAVTALWGGIIAVTNLHKYKKKRLSREEAIKNTAAESIGAGISASLGLIAGNVVRATLAASAAASLATFAVGVVVTGGAKILWNHAVIPPTGSLPKKPAGMASPKD